MRSGDRVIARVAHKCRQQVTVVGQGSSRQAGLLGSIYEESFLGRANLLNKANHQHVEITASH